MNKRTGVALIIISILVLSVGLYAYFQSEDEYSWQKSYKKEGKDPYDLSLFRSLCKYVDKDHSLEEIDAPFSAFQRKILKSDNRTNNVFIHIGHFKTFDHENADSLISFAHHGNIAMIFEEHSMLNFNTIINHIKGLSSESNIEDTVEVSQDAVITDNDDYDDISDTVNHSLEDELQQDTVEVSDTSFTDATNEDDEDRIQYTNYTNTILDSCVVFDFSKLGLKPDGKLMHCYYYDFKPLETNYHYFIDSLISKSHKSAKYEKLEYLGFLQENPILIRYKVGKGYLYLCSQPILLTNYFLKEKDGLSFINALFSEVNDHEVYLNSHTHFENSPNNKNFTPLKYILSQKPLKWAFYVFIVLLIIFFIFFSKRRQKIIPVISLKENSTIEYVETISRLYQSKKANKDIFEIITKNLYKFILHKYNIRFKEYDEVFENRLSKISGISIEALQSIFNDIKLFIQDKNNVSNQNLYEFYNKVKNFYNNCK